MVALVESVNAYVVDLRAWLAPRLVCEMAGGQCALSWPAAQVSCRLKSTSRMGLAPAWSRRRTRASFNPTASS